MITFLIIIVVIIGIAILLNRYFNKPKQPVQEMVSDNLENNLEVVMNICPNCKTELLSEVKFCPNCGTNLAILSMPAPSTKTAPPNKTSGIKPALIAVGVTLMIVFIIWLSNRSEESDGTSTSSYEVPNNKVPKVNDLVVKDGRVGNYTYSYSKTDGYIAVTFDGKGIDIGVDNAGQKYEDTMILTAIMQTVNSISGFKDININDLKNYTVENGKIILKGKNCYYKVSFIIDGNYITGMVYNDCN